MILQGDGNLVLYVLATGKAVWNSQTNGKPVVWASMQTDGNFVLYNANYSKYYWNSQTCQSPFPQAGYVTLQNDRNLVVYLQVFGMTTMGPPFYMGYFWQAKWNSKTNI